MPRKRALLAAAATLALAAAVVGIAVARGRHEGDSSAATGPGGSTLRGPTAPGRDPGTIVPGSSIGAVTLGMTESAVNDLYGRGAEGQWVARGRNGARVTYSGGGGALSVSYYDGRVVQIATTGSHYVMDNGIRVGSQVPETTGAGLDAALRTGQLEELEPGVYAEGFRLRGAPELLPAGRESRDAVIQNPVSAHVGSVFVTDARFLAYLPAHVDPNPYTGGEDFFCAERPLED